MFGKITEYMLNKHVERKLGKYDIKMVHFIPGRIRLQSPRWKANVTLIEKVVKELHAQPLVFSVQPTPVTGSLVITYDASYITNIQELDSWFRVLDQVYTTEYLK
ncbi:metal ABC transporter ATPase [Peribacillus simplex]|uniref:HMA2 domain-containing protein n=1 Tax=Peribacillus simplex TaxID=1478 RepID=UPI00203D0B41|nr:metal ABC transporter ATPase [Peribacillus simplex]MCM3676654.1 metal ABC transporter ATPase [Peribacillus simplex]